MYYTNKQKKTKNRESSLLNENVLVKNKENISDKMIVNFTVTVKRYNLPLLF